jgi:hypothetical protein
LNIDKIKIELKVAIRCINEEHTKKILKGVLEELDKPQCITIQGTLLGSVTAEKTAKLINEKLKNISLGILNEK